MAAAATVLANIRQYPAAIQIYECLRREVPAEPEYPRALLLAEEAAGDQSADRTVNWRRCSKARTPSAAP